MRVSDAELHTLPASSGRIAVVGHSDKPYRASYQIGQYLREAGYRVFAVNPLLRSLLDEPAYPDLRSLPEPVDMVNVFRRSEHLAQVVTDAIAVGARAVWTQFGVEDAAAAERGRAAGLTISMNRCLKVEHQRLGIPRRA